MFQCKADRLDDIGNMGRGRTRLTFIYPGKALRFHHFPQSRENRPVTWPPHEPRTYGERREAGGICRQDEAFCCSFTLRIQEGRAEGIRISFVDLPSGLPVEYGRFRSNVNETAYPCLTRRLEELFSSLDIDRPELFSCSPLAYMSSTMDEHI